MKLRLPAPLGTYRGKPYARYTVVMTRSAIEAQHSESVEVIATSPTEACNVMRDEIAAHVHQPTEIECAGPKGGITHRFIGWESMIGAQLVRDCELRHAAAHQIPLLPSK